MVVVILYIYMCSHAHNQDPFRRMSFPFDFPLDHSISRRLSGGGIRAGCYGFTVSTERAGQRTTRRSREGRTSMATVSRM